MNELLEELVPPFEEAADWDDVLRRAGPRRRPRRTVVAAVAAACAVVVAAPALAVFLRADAVGLPSAADRSNVAVVLDPPTGRVLLEAAPWKAHRGFCYLALRTRAGCVAWKARGTLVTEPPLFGWTFDDRVRSAVAVTGRVRVPLRVVHFGGRIDATLFVARNRLVRGPLTVELRDAARRVVARVRVG